MEVSTYVTATPLTKRPIWSLMPTNASPGCRWPAVQVREGYLETWPNRTVAWEFINLPTADTLRHLSVCDPFHDRATRRYYCGLHLAPPHVAAAVSQVMPQRGVPASVWHSFPSLGAVMLRLVFVARFRCIAGSTYIPICCLKWPP